jgi:UDP-N-acetylmuramoyl-L-alanyl-D-glutamate--2,6-diaminopimelate ligase
MEQRGASAVTMEVSSHALALGRVDGVTFSLGLFTNLTQDHLDFHGDMESYFAVKSRLFLEGRIAQALICLDDEYGRRLARATRAAGVATTTYSLADPRADWTVTAAAALGRGVQVFTVRDPGGGLFEAEVPLPGRFNVANALAAFAGAGLHGVSAEVSSRSIRDFPGVPGRMESVRMGQPFLALVDYAHTPDAVRRAIQAARGALASGGRVMTVLGCGGDRDREKRPAMGRIASEESDFVIITDDNPRSEAPEAIRRAIQAGAEAVEHGRRAEVLVEGDRGRAIALAVGLAGPTDAVLILGKGHEQGQESQGVTTPFDDRAQLRSALKGIA